MPDGRPLLSPVAPDLRPLFLPHNRFGASPPLAGITVLLVEDSRFACDAMRLMCQRLGARLRRADTLAQARIYLGVIRPDVVIIDLGLPDGRGEVLIAELTAASRHTAPTPVVLATSGDPDGQATALAAGAVGFLDKPLRGLAAFLDMILPHLPGQSPRDRADLGDAAIHPDPLALHDDLAHAVALLANNPDAQTRRYIAGFVSGVARLSHDSALERAAAATASPGAQSDLATLLADRVDGDTTALLSPP